MHEAFHVHGARFGRLSFLIWERGNYPCTKLGWRRHALSACLRDPFTGPGPSQEPGYRPHLLIHFFLGASTFLRSDPRLTLVFPTACLPLMTCTNVDSKPVSKRADVGHRLPDALERFPSR